MRLHQIRPLLLLLVLAVAFAPVKAQSNGELCQLEARYARAVMTSRQMGRPIEDVYQIATSELHRWMILEAWKRPQYINHTFRQKEIDDFTTRMFILCAEKNP